MGMLLLMTKGQTTKQSKEKVKQTLLQLLHYVLPVILMVRPATIQKKWILEVLNNTIIGCNGSGLPGCLAGSVASTGVS